MTHAAGEEQSLLLIFAELGVLDDELAVEAGCCEAKLAVVYCYTVVDVYLAESAEIVHFSVKLLSAEAHALVSCIDRGVVHPPHLVRIVYALALWCLEDGYPLCSEQKNAAKSVLFELVELHLACCCVNDHAVPIANFEHVIIDQGNSLRVADTLVKHCGCFFLRYWQGHVNQWVFSCPFAVDDLDARPATFTNGVSEANQGAYEQVHQQDARLRLLSKDSVRLLD